MVKQSMQSKRSKTVKNGHKWSQTVKNGQTLSKTVKNVFLKQSTPVNIGQYGQIPSITEKKSQKKSKTLKNNQ